MADKSINVLLIEDSDEDAKLIKSTLQYGGYNASCTVVDNPEKLKSTLPLKKWDLVISDFAMPRFNGVDAWKIFRQTDTDTPFIILSGSTGEDIAVEAIKMGVNDYILKSNMPRLVPAIDRELREAELRSQSRKSEEEKQKMQAQLMQSSKLAALGQMAAGIAHELNNPLTIIMGNAQFLKVKKDVSEDLKGIFTEIDNASQRCKKIIADLLEFSRLNETDMDKCSINDIIDNVLRLVSYQSEFKAIEVKKDFSNTLPPVLINISRIEQVFINIATNAAHAMPKGGSLTITTAYNEAAKTVEASFSDTGEGIPPEVLPDVFDPFFTTKKKGTGLGLSISNKIIQLHEGKITVNSPGRGKGSIFTVILPAIIHE